ncbi:MAG: formyltransferase family protein [Polyangiaceae bacterium]
MRIAFFGLPLAAWLLHRDGHDLDPVVLSPLPAPGRRRVKRLLGDVVIDALLTPRQTLGARVEARLDGAEVLLSWFWTRRLPEGWLGRCPLGAYGVHPSLLPRHRGPDPFFWAIDAADARTGVTLHHLAADYDTGDIVWQEEFGGEELRTGSAWRLAKALDRPSLRLLRRAARELSDGRALPRTSQDEASATWAPAPDGDLLKCPWSAGTAAVVRRVRALSPEPGVPLEIAGLRLDLLKASSDERLPLALLPGEAQITSSAVRIRTGDGGVRVERVRLESGQEVDGTRLAELVSARTQVIDSRESLEGTNERPR